MIKAKSSKIIILAVILILIGTVGLIFNFLVHKKNSELSYDNYQEYLGIKTDNNEIGEISQKNEDDWKIYTNKKANFSISYPSYLFVIEEHKNLGYKDYESGRIIFCSEKINKSQNYCFDGLQILYGIPESDGWGGGCDLEFHKQIMVMGESISVCKSVSGISQIYLENPYIPAKINISASYKNFFRESDALKMIDSFKFISN